ncbi:MAG: 3,4-dehydroadipyl-CoA semialdehyde dehydrogenase [Planctomycetes bacterium]|nr:3,4-dehydroadipyl-CoA semialdehyde dehydrogenase [Planctomycetota bacterium]
MQRLSSYVLGAWHTGGDRTATLYDPTTDEAVAACSTDGIDFAAVVRHGREVGGPALRAMTFAERGALLKALSAAIHEHREELIEIGCKSGGNTRGDAKFDIDGATGTLAAYAHFSKSLGDKRYIADGEQVQLGRTKRFVGAHVRVPRQGVAVHVNAFNFPAWGMMEKLACAILAGVPVIEKPGTPTAWLAWRVAQITVDSGLLPEGAFQFLCGSVGDLLDHLGPQDGLAFTGSAATGAKLKGHPGLVARNVRVNLEADSLNAAVLAPDVDASCETYALFLQNLVTDITQKTGQKCTAVRRIFVPRDRVDEVRDDLVAALGRVKVGDPRDGESRMGPLASKAQFEDVRNGIARFSEFADVACGGAEPLFDKGCFLAPTLLVAKDARAELFHAEEVFGPVSTILPYGGGVEEAVELVGLGRGSLVSSIYTNDADWAEAYVLGAGCWHGRVWIGSDRMAEQALAPGMVLPAMVHGGPGRAGGGEELGELRGLEFYTQRVALQGFSGLLEGKFGG